MDSCTLLVTCPGLTSLSGLSGPSLPGALPAWRLKALVARDPNVRDVVAWERGRPALLPHGGRAPTFAVKAVGLFLRGVERRRS